MSPKIIIPITVVISVVLTVAVMYSADFEEQTQTSQTPTPEIIYVDKIMPEFFEGTHDVKKISSQEELKSIIDASLLFGDHFYDDRMIARSIADDGAMMWEMEERAMPTSVPSTLDAIPKTGSRDSDYSTTNIQVANVDEPDYLKNDSKYVYIVSENTLSIIDAYPAESAKLILKIALDIESQHLQNMFLNNDRLVIFYNGQSDDEVIPQYDFVPRRSYSSVTHALIIDVSDKENPIILKDYSIDGHFRDARMIGDYAYFVTNSNVDYQYPKLPGILERSIPIMTPNAFYFDNVEEIHKF